MKLDMTIRFALATALFVLCAVAEDTVIFVPAGETMKGCAGCRLDGGRLVKTGPGTLDLTGSVLRNAGLDIREGAVRFSSTGNATVCCRYVRWKISATRPAKPEPPEYGNSGAQFSEFRLFRGGKLLPRPPRATALNASSWREGPQCGIDGDLKTKCYNGLFIADFGEEVTFDGYSYATANDAIGRDPAGWTLEAGFANGSEILWSEIGRVSGFTAPKERFAEVGKVFPVSLSDVIPHGYPVHVGGCGRLVLVGVSEQLEGVSGTGLVQLESGASVTFSADSAFAGSVIGGTVRFFR